MRHDQAAAVATVVGLVLAASSAQAQSPAVPPPPSPSPVAGARLAVPSLIRYEDAAGDQAGGGGPDIVALTISQPDPASVSIALDFAAAPPLSADAAEGWTDMLMIIGATGSDGVRRLDDGVDADFIMGVHGANLEDGGALLVGDRLDEDAVQVDVAGATLTLTTTRKALGDPDRILFFVAVGRESVRPDEAVEALGDGIPDNGESGPFVHALYWFVPSGGSG